NELYQALFPGRTLVGKPIREALPELEGQGIHELLDSVYQSGQPYIGNEVFVELDRDGGGTLSGSYFNLIYFPTRNPKGRVEGILVHGVEVTELARSRRALTDENERIEAIVAERTRELEAQTEVLRHQKELTARIIDHAPISISYLDKNLVYEWVNPSQAETYGIPVEQWLGRTVYDVLGPETEAQTRAYWEQALSGEPFYAQGFPFKYSLDGEDRWTYWDFSYVPVRGANGEVEGVLVHGQEVTDRVQREREQERMVAERIETLEASDRLKDRFLSILSHELRTPINAIMGFGSVLEDELAGTLNEQQAAFVHKILGSSEALLALVDDLLDMSRIQAGKFTIQPAPMALPEAVREVLSSLAPAGAAKELTLSEHLESTLPPVMADQQRVVQVLSNLLGNAIKFTPRGGRIIVRACVEGDFVHCEVTDNGPGIAEANQEQLFEAFTQVDMSYTRAQGGVGLGLTICRSLVEAHGGQIGVESVPGEGATFWFTLPLAPPPA
ncbi:MAG: ATP-binding protein, partial [Candidatus Sericytochromatia bacterium]